MEDQKARLDRLEKQIDQNTESIVARLEDKIDASTVHLASIDITLAKQSVLLEEHMKRSLANEKQVELLRKQMWIWAMALIGFLAKLVFFK